ncbi:MAG: hypothetical protein VB122_00890 [Erysipelotrichales bacterium]|nr:hypothetical protein [Erysipelotrichales bacterium]
MVGIIICTHGEFANGLKNAIEMIVGQQKNFDVICFKNGDDIENLKESLLSLSKKYRKKNIPCCYIVDLYGATPFNACVTVSIEEDRPVITGVNLPILLELLMTRENYTDVDFMNYLNNSLQNAKESMQVINVKSLF